MNEWISNSREIMNSIFKSKWSKGLSDLDLSGDYLSLERALGLHWNVEKISLTFKVKSRGKPTTTRDFMLVINSIYDPLGFKVVLPIRIFLQKLRRTNFGWDNAIPVAEKGQWLNWLEQPPKLSSFTLPSCL